MSSPALEELIGERNFQNRTEAWMQLGFGALALLVAVVMIFFTGFVVACTVWPRWAFTIAAAITAIYLAAATWSAWRNVEPLDGITALDFGPFGAVGFGLQPNFLGALFGARGRVAALASGLISGPHRILRSWRATRSIIRVDDEQTEEVMALLRRCKPPGALPENVELDPAYGLARLLKLVKEQGTMSGQNMIVLTTKGRQVLGL